MSIEATPLVGTWQLVSRVDRSADAAVLSESAGSAVTGFLVYDAGGRVFAQIMLRDRAPSTRAMTIPEAGDAASYVDGYYAYFGRYEVDTAAGKIVHHLDGALALADVGRTIARHFSLEGDTLTLSFKRGVHTGAPITRTLIWRRSA